MPIESKLAHLQSGYSYNYSTPPLPLSPLLKPLAHSFNEACFLYRRRQKAKRPTPSLTLLVAGNAKYRIENKVDIYIEREYIDSADELGSLCRRHNGHCDAL